jgi:putative Holliday junction resolvase
MARVMGIDYGSKRVGVALTDEDGRIAFPKAVLPNDKFLLSNLKELVEGHTVTEIVIGESINNAGQENAVARSARALAHALEADVGATIHYEPEFWSSQEVRAHTGARYVDAEAAAIILNSFLTKRYGNHH